MIVDDEEWVADVSRQLLQVLGYTPVCFVQPFEALAEFKQNPDSFDLVISDQKMPQMLGTEFVNQIRKLNPNIPVILMSGNLSPIEPADSLTTYMKKPFSISELQKHIHECLSKKPSEPLEVERVNRPGYSGDSLV